ncbi:SRPBCC family protein [Rhizobium calliandrae]|uniref:SRPBCC family protein n=1 Tax=Rhizobium calliandrae TaxID=1312182 RepID=A0ABT7KFC6_9HYPH|nr:SRPBCC family protein [Rhizobium calliandrae]MDL2406698.1 SRPBCC family protein [Rhizobium calliandrae]
MNSDRIEKKIVLKADQERVWRGISDSASFGAWFGVEIDGGKEAIGRIAPTKVDPEVARLQEPYVGFPWRVMVERIVPMTLFSFRWHPGAVDPNSDYSSEPMTLVTFELAQVDGGTLLTITESGFEQLPLDRRTAARDGNDAGWAHQTKLIEKYLALDEQS